MKLSDFFSSTTATCTTTAVVALACCPLVMSIRAHREARGQPTVAREIVPVRQPLPPGTKPSPWMVVSQGAKASEFSRPVEISVLKRTDPPAVEAVAEQVEAPTSPTLSLNEATNAAPAFESDQEAALAELQPPSTLLISIDAPTAPVHSEWDRDALDKMAFLPPQSDLNHPPSTNLVTEKPDSEKESPAVDFLELVPAADPALWNRGNDALAVVGQRADQSIQRAFKLADKGALYSARKQLETGLQTIALGLDAHHGVQAHCDCLACGLLALQEAKDFLPTPGSARSRSSVASTIAKHRSQVIPKGERDQLEVSEAMRRYYTYAQRHLVAAVGGSPVASQAFYGLGKLAMLQTTQDVATQRAHNLNALALFQVAVHTQPANYLAANELGVLLAREGRLEDARTALQMSVAAHPMAETWQNLTVVHERLGEHERSAQARMEWQRVAQSTQTGQTGLLTAANGPPVHWVDKATFERGIAPAAPMHGNQVVGGSLR